MNPTTNTEAGAVADVAAWSAFDSAPRDGRLFLALNHDHEVWVCKFIDDRIVFRMNGRYEPRKFTNVSVNGETLLREDVKFAKDGECWRSDWTFWSRLYEFKPICWLPLPRPPAHLTSQGAASGVPELNEHMFGQGSNQ